MKTLPGGMPLTADVARPVYLLELTFPSAGIVRYSSRETIEINSKTYITSGFSVTSLETDANGTTRCTVDIPAQDGAIRALVLNEAFQGEPANVWKIYGNGPWTDADRVSRFEGVMDGTPTGTKDRVVLEMISEAAEVAWSPRHRAGPPWNNFIPAPGSKITWGDEVFTLPGGD